MVERPHRGLRWRPRWRPVWVSLVVFASLIWAWPAAAEQKGKPATATGTFLSLSDLHFDPFYDPILVPKLVKADVREWRRLFEGSKVSTVSTYGSDTNYLLLRSALAALRGTVRRPDFILVSGDFLGHNFQEKFQQASPGSNQAAYLSFVHKTLAFVTAGLRQTFPQVPIYPALGNNDSDCGDYAIEPGGPFLAAAAELWRPLLGGKTGTFAETFRIGGFYSVPHPTVPRLRIVVLNSDFFSRKYKDTCGAKANLTALQLGWLAYTLQRAALAGETVWIMEHIPPGIDVFATLSSHEPCPASPVSLWQPEALATYQQILAAAPGTVVATFAGHTHIDDFRLLAGGFVHGTPAVSPVYDNNPGFQVFSFDRSSGALTDLRTFFLDVSGSGTGPWSFEYSFQQAYGQTGYTTAALQSLQQAIVNDPKVRSVFLENYPVHSRKGAPNPENWKAYSCGIVSPTTAEFAECYCEGR
jgi:sphingomyelin phosphodiesterase acid-like 3